MTKDEALRMALDFVVSISPAFICEATHHEKNKRHADNEPCPYVKKQLQTYEAIKEALAQPQQEPVAWYVERQHAGFRDHGLKCGPFWKLSEAQEWTDSCHILKELFNAPPQRKPLQPQSPCEMTQAERKMFKLGWLECEAAHDIKE